MFQVKAGYQALVEDRELLGTMPLDRVVAVRMAHLLGTLSIATSKQAKEPIMSTLKNRLTLKNEDILH